MSTPDKAVATGCFPTKNRFGYRRHGSFAEMISKKPRLRLDDKVAVITGAASGIGAATARLFVSQGAKVIIADVQAEAGRKLSLELGSSAHFFRCDVTKEADVAAAVDYAVECWGHLDIMFNNAGVPGSLAGLAEIDMEEFDQVIAVHVKGAVLGVKHAARVMIPAGKGVILFSGSTSSKMGGVGPPLHSAANAAVLCITRSAAAELVRHGIRVNAVSPHCVATPMDISAVSESLNPKEDITVEQIDEVLADSSELDALTTEKVASAVMFLASDEAGFISGHNLVLDGGFSVTKEFVSSDLKAALLKSTAARRKAETQSQVGPPTRSREGSGTNKLSTPSIAKEREMEDKPTEKEEKQEKASPKALAEKEERKKREKERKVEDEKARAKQQKALAIEDKARAKEAKALAANGQAAKDLKTPATGADIHPLDKRASAKDERMQSENIELPNAGPEPDIPLEHQSRPPVKKISSLFSRGKTLSKEEGKAEGRSTDPGKVSEKGTEGGKSSDPGKVSNKDEKKGKSTDPENDSKREAAKSQAAKEEITPESQPKQSPVTRAGSLLGLGKDSTKADGKENKSDDPGKVSKKEKQEEKSADPKKVSKKEANSPAKKEKTPPKLKDSPKIPASSEIAARPQPKQSPMIKIIRLFSLDKNSKRKGKTVTWGKDNKKEDTKEDKSLDAGKVSKKMKKAEKSADPVKVSKKETKSPGKEEKTRPKSKQSPKRSASPEIIPEPQPKQSPILSVGRLLNWGADPTKKKDESANPGKVSKK